MGTANFTARNFVARPEGGRSGRRLAVLGLAALVFSMLFPAGGAQAAPPEHVQNSWIVTLKPNENPDQAHAMAKEKGGKARHVYRHAVRGFNFEGTAQQAKRFENDPRVEAVEPDRVVSVTADTLPWGVMRVDGWHNNAPDAYEAGYRGQGVRVAILDTGIDLDHPDLNVNASLGKNCTTSNTLDDKHGHGTHVAGTVAATHNGSGVLGVAPEVQVVPVKVLGDTGSGSDSTIMCGVDHLTALIKDSISSNNVLVGNMSLSGSGSSGSCSSGLRKAVCTATAAGIVITAAAGNDNKNASGSFPANYPEVITVSAICDSDGEPGNDGHASFSNYGSIVDVTAPGCSVYSTAKNGGYTTMSGTSMAAPHAAAVAALVKEQQPAMSYSDVEKTLEDTGECPDGTKNTGGGDCSGQGKWSGDDDGVPEPSVNALFAAQAADGNVVANTAPTVSWNSPSDGSTVSGAVTLKIQASDSQDASGTLNVTYSVDGGTAKTAAYNATSGYYEASWDTTTTSNASHSLTATAKDSGGLTSSKTISVTISNSTGGGGGSSATGFVDDFESSKGWTIAGLWHGVSNSGCLTSPKYTSATTVYYYGQDSKCTYDTGSHTTGMLTSPAFSIGDGATFSFNHWREVESYTGGAYDQTYVQVSYDNGGSWTTVWSKDSRDSSEKAWTAVSLDLGNAAASQMKVRFAFDSRDKSYNAYKGWFIDDVSVTSEPPDAAPSVTWVEPADAAQVSGSSVKLKVEATDAEDGSLGVTFKVDGTAISGTPAKSGNYYELYWDSTKVGDGSHTLTAEAKDSAGNVKTASRSIRTENTNDPPTVSWVNPKPGSQVSGTITLKIQASDPENQPLTVKWRVDSGTLSSASYNSTSGYWEASWNSAGVGDGSHTLYAEASDGTNTRNNSIIITTENTNSVPTVSWSSPSNGATVQGSVPISVAASDAEDGKSLTVEWQVDSGSWQAAPYNSSTGRFEATWSTSGVANGSHTLTARATDTGAKSSTHQISVTVDNPPFLLFEQFEGSATGWGWTGLWHKPTTCVSPSGSSGTGSAYFGQESTCNYSTGSRVTGELTSPSFSGVGSKVRLSFSHWREVEYYTSGAYDQAFVEVSYNGGTWTTVWSSDSRTPSEKAWTPVSLDLTTAGSSMRVRFRFDSRDKSYNTYRGWLLDDVKVENL